MILDFHNIDYIGPAFADEIFRVFRKENPEIKLHWIRANDAVGRMIRRAFANGEKTLPIPFSDAEN